MNKNTSAVVSSSLLEKLAEQFFCYVPEVQDGLICSGTSSGKMITITKETGLGLKILGGINRNEGPLVYIQEIIPGGDCYKDGRLKPGDQLVSINKESMIGVSFEEAKSIITRAKLRSESAWEIAFIRQKSDGSHLENPSCTSLLQASGEYGPQASTFSLLPSPPEILIPKTSSTPQTTDTTLSSFNISQIKTGYKKTEQTPITSSENSPADMSNTDIAPAWTDNYGPQGKKISLNPSVRLKAEKLEMLLPCDSSETDEIERLKRERNDALEEVNALKEKLFESERQKKQLTEELQNVKQEAKAVVEETRALRSRIHLAEAAQRQAHGMEMDYEEVIHLLETEITDLKAQLADCSDQNKESVQELRKRITVLDCQLRKSEMARKTFEASTEKLLHFVETIQELFSDNSSPLSSLSERPMLASQTSLTPLRRNGRNIPATLALESKELVKSVRAILDMDYLPYGWEEAYTADGIKYFIKCEFLSYEDQKSPLLEAYLTLLSWNELIRLYHLTASRHVHSLYPVSIKASSFGKPPLSPSGRWKKKKKGRNPFHFTKAKLS
ncbi:syntaxin-binding protein 4 isoform X10 [Canis lupus familiaris]|uniref:syntaxin-binding protein 4 isoform X10 n=1 Tax=Canis lupus familiaris TaxID=9615 RepID=UPI000BAA132E|nr:syntaxin-binding protein 4 isoform X10 [Canis lupus familiaris]XP_038403699.1 syntaxin-binding protein 4 isoform X10 [Canis lupus familiaris]XP_038532900.1 syntaxin-binding protein 4 isoform X10 [Canis lupus familiaris]|eukprot:XP_022278851.1 syntaxin-binding protein 4 isoform X10 [Canis lupus familiaris]